MVTIKLCRITGQECGDGECSCKNMSFGFCFIKNVYIKFSCTNTNIIETEEDMVCPVLLNSIRDPDGRTWKILS